MTWTQGQPFRSNQPPFTDIDPQDTGQQPPVSRNYTRSNDHRQDHRQRQSPPRQNMRQQDVAATFTQEGLQTFSMIFSSAVEAAIAKSLPDLVERAVERAIERKLLEVVSNLHDEIDVRTSDLGTVIRGQIESTMTTQLAPLLDELREKHVPQTPVDTDTVDTDTNEVSGTNVENAENVSQVALTTAEDVSDRATDMSETAEDVSPVAMTTAADVSEAAEHALKGTIQAAAKAPQVAAEASEDLMETANVTQSNTEDQNLDEDIEKMDEDGELAIEDAEVLYQRTQRERWTNTSTVTAASNPGSRHRGRVHEEGRIVIEALRKLGRPVKTSELPTLIQDIHWGTNPSAKIKNFMDRSNGQIQRTGRGVYAYHAIPH